MEREIKDKNTHLRIKLLLLCFCIFMSDISIDLRCLCAPQLCSIAGYAFSSLDSDGGGDYPRLFLYNNSFDFCLL